MMEAVLWLLSCLKCEFYYSVQKNDLRTELFDEWENYRTYNYLQLTIYYSCRTSTYHVTFDPRLDYIKMFLLLYLL